jgi:hypothetical protein
MDGILHRGSLDERSRAGCFKRAGAISAGFTRAVALKIAGYLGM